MSLAAAAAAGRNKGTDTDFQGSDSLCPALFYLPGNGLAETWILVRAEIYLVAIKNEEI